MSENLDHQGTYPGTSPGAEGADRLRQAIDRLSGQGPQPSAGSPKPYEKPDRNNSNFLRGDSDQQTLSAEQQKLNSEQLAQIKRQNPDLPS